MGNGLLKSLSPVSHRPLRTFQAFSPHTQRDAGAEEVPEHVVCRLPLCAAQKLRQRSGGAEEVCGPAGYQNMGRHRVHQLRPL